MSIDQQFGRDSIKFALLTAHLEATVPFKIHDYLLQGGPSEQDVARCRNTYCWELGSHGDALLFRTKDTARMAALLIDALAILAFCPGGVTVFGCHFEAKVPEPA